MAFRQIIHLAYFALAFGVGLSAAPNCAFAAGQFGLIRLLNSEGEITLSDVKMTGAKARPGYFAELEELEAARKAGTLAAYDLFLARHPKSHYAKIAMAERAALIGK